MSHVIFKSDTYLCSSVSPFCLAAHLKHYESEVGSAYYLKTISVLKHRKTRALTRLGKYLKVGQSLWKIKFSFLLAGSYPTSL